jgi:hypothetical protein
VPPKLTPGKVFLADASCQKRALDDLYATLQDPDTDHDLRRQLGPQLQHVLAQAQLLIQQRKLRGSANPLCLIATPFDVPDEPQTVKRNRSAAEVSRSRVKAVPATPHEITKGAAAQAQPFCKNAASVACQAHKLPKTLPARRERQADQAAKKPTRAKSAAAAASHAIPPAVHSTNTDQGNWRGTMPIAADLSIASQPTTPRDALTDVLVTPSARNLAAALPHQLTTAPLHVFGAHDSSLAQSSLACNNTALSVHTMQTLSVYKSRSRPAATPGMPSIHPSTVAARDLTSHCAVSRSTAALGAMSSHALLYRPSCVQPSVADLSTSHFPCYHMAAALSQPYPPGAAQFGRAIDTSSHAMSAAQRAAIEASASGMIARSAKR